MAKPKLKKPKCKHRKVPALVNYREYMADSRLRADRGERQKWCHVCRKFVWDPFWNEKKKVDPAGRMGNPAPEGGKDRSGRAPAES